MIAQTESKVELIVEKISGLKLSTWGRKQIDTFKGPKDLIDTQIFLLTGVRNCFCGGQWLDFFALMWLIILGIVLALTAVSFTLTYYASKLIGAWAAVIVVGILIALVLYSARGLKKKTIAFNILQDNVIDGLQLGALEQILEWEFTFWMTSFMSAGIFGTHMATIYIGTSEHINLFTAYLTTLDYFIEVLSFDTTGVLGIHFGLHGESLTWWARVITVVCKFTYAATIIFGIYSFMRWYKLRPFIEKLKWDLDYAGIVSFIENVYRNPKNPCRELHDEIIFLMLVDHYVKKDYDMVSKLSKLFCHIDVDNYIRQLFIHPKTGSLLFELKEEH